MPCFFMPVWVVYGFLSAPIPPDLIPTSATLQSHPDWSGPLSMPRQPLSGGYNRLLPSGVGKHPGTCQTPPCGPAGTKRTQGAGRAPQKKVLRRCYHLSRGLSDPDSYSGSREFFQHFTKISRLKAERKRPIFPGGTASALGSESPHHRGGEFHSTFPGVHGAGTQREARAYARPLWRLFGKHLGQVITPSPSLVTRRPAKC